MVKNRLKLLLIINQLEEAGGAEVQLLHLTRGLSQRGHDVTLCCIDSSDLPRQALEKDGIELIELGAKSRYARFPATLELARLARKADVVQCTMWDPSLWGRIAAFLARRPVVVADHATDRAIQIAASGAPRERWIRLHNRLLDRITYATIACATSQRAVLLDEGVADGKIVYIPNGIPLSETLDIAAGVSERAEVGLPESGPIAMQVGIFRQEKNQMGALEAFVEVRKSVPDAQLVFVGGGELKGDVELKADVEARAAELGADWAHFLGHRSDVPALLKFADLMLLPSISDAMPMVVLEGLALGVPVLSTDVGDVRMIVGDAGVCVPPGDFAAFATEAARMLGSGDTLAAMKDAAIERSRDFDSSLMIDRYVDLFEGAIADSAPRLAVPSVF